MAVKFKDKFFAPFLIVKREKLYIGWVIYAIIFGLINLLGDILMGNISAFSEYITTGQFYTFSIALCSPLIVDMLLSIIVERKTTKKVHFLSYKIPTVLITFILTLIMAFLWVGDYKGKLLLQVFLTIISLFLAYYMFLVSHMQDHNDITEEYDDKEYLKTENQRLQEVQNKVDEIINIDMKGDIVEI